MKNLFITERGAIEMVNNEPKYKNSDRNAIDNVYLITEDTHIVYNRYDGKRIELNAEAGDILIKFYESTFSSPIIIVHSEEWKNNILAYNEAEQKRKEEWAAKAAKSNNVVTEEISESQDLTD